MGLEPSAHSAQLQNNPPEALTTRRARFGSGCARTCEAAAAALLAADEATAEP